MTEDNPPNVPADPVPDELKRLEDRFEEHASRLRTLPPPDVDSRMVALALSSMATTLERMEAMMRDTERTVATLERQHEQTMRSIIEARGTANLAGSMAARALEEIQETRQVCERIESNVGKLARSMQGIDERSKSLYESVFPERDSPSTPPDIELADVVPIHRSRHVLTGE